MSSFLVALAHANIVAAGAIAVVLLSRRLFRMRFGAMAAYGLWVIVPIASLVSLLPPPQALNAVSLPPLSVPVALAFEWREPVSALVGWTPLIFAFWFFGVAISVCLVAYKQRRFYRLAAMGRAGPAVAGTLLPRIVVPADFGVRFTAEERRVILLHERSHLTRHDAQINALITLAQCINWFNPLIHVAAFYARLDQELACDDEVIRRSPKDRRLYAEALLKTQMASDALPLGCYWPPQTIHPLEERIAMLTKTAPTKRLRLAGAALVATLSLGSAFAAAATGQSSTPAQIADSSTAGLTMRLVAVGGGAGTGATPVATSDGDLLLEPTVLITGDMIASANATPDGAGRAIVSVEFTQEGKTRFASLTKANVGRKLAILVNGAVVSAPVIQQEMSLGAAQISGPGLEMTEALKLAAAIVPARSAR